MKILILLHILFPLPIFINKTSYFLRIIGNIEDYYHIFKRLEFDMIVIGKIDAKKLFLYEI